MNLFVHPLQFLVTRDMQQLMSLVNQYEQLVNTVRVVETQTIKASTARSIRHGSDGLQGAGTALQIPIAPAYSA